MYVSSNAEKATGSIKNKITKITRVVEDAKHPYNTTGDLGWMNEEDIKLYSSEIIYDELIKNGIITIDEKCPEAEVTREDAFMYLIRMAGLEKVARLENIYKVSYADSNKLSSGKIGYCAILSGLGVICGSGGYLRPTDNLNRAEAITMLYRYLLMN